MGVFLLVLSSFKELVKLRLFLVRLFLVICVPLPLNTRDRKDPFAFTLFGP